MAEQASAETPVKVVRNMFQEKFCDIHGHLMSRAPCGKFPPD
jgi:hypothetical protein